MEKLDGERLGMAACLHLLPEPGGGVSGYSTFPSWEGRPPWGPRTQSALKEVALLSPFLQATTWPLTQTLISLPPKAQGGWCHPRVTLHLLPPALILPCALPSRLSRQAFPPKTDRREDSGNGFGRQGLPPARWLSVAGGAHEV